MERIQALIDKLYEQRQQHCNPAQLLLTVQLLQTELLKLQQKNGSLGTAKVAVTLPVNMNFSEEVSRASLDVPVSESKPVPPVREEPAVAPQPAPVYEREAYNLRKPAVTEDVAVRSEPPVYKPAAEVLNPAFSTTVEAPTLSQQPLKKEVHEILAEKKESLNDRLKQEKTEVVHLLKETPIKDLRKGIGINDRFSFVNELFRGDEAMYERSIKTINSFQILSEAEYWINRELKFKLGWNDNREIVQHFYQLVRRRFA
ncbi:MAG TPA: hypothetical protein VFR58_08715 [Flavisolibacter sp.]|nr:hypothetical protein [Flavisolibacter sp.]